MSALAAYRGSRSVEHRSGRALVLGSGGVTGIGWMSGVLHALTDGGLMVNPGADLVIGTSAGSAVGAAVAQPVAGGDKPRVGGLGTALTTEIPAGLRLNNMARLIAWLGRPGDQSRALRGLGRAAGRTPDLAERRLAVIEARIGDRDWPDGIAFWVTAVNADTGRPVVFTRDSGVRLADAVAASCAVPMVWPPVRIGEHRYMDGGMRSPLNLDLAAGFEKVIAICPIPQFPRRAARPHQQLRALGPATRSLLIVPDPDARKAMGRNILATSTMAAAAQAGEQQGRRVLEQALSVWE